MGNQTTLWVRRNSLDNCDNELCSCRDFEYVLATRGELVAAVSQIDGAEDWAIRLGNGIERMLKGMPIDRPFMEQQLQELRTGRYLVVPVGEGD